MLFEWDYNKESENITKHHVSFELAKHAFFDINRITTLDDEHSTKQEKRYFCFGMVDEKIMTVRFTLRDKSIRIIGAGYWRKGKKFYEQRNKL